MEKINFSRTKEKISYLYTQNCRRPYSSTGKIIKKSPQYVRRLLQQYEEEKTLLPYVLADYSHLGLTAFKVYFRGGYARESELNKLLNYIGKSKVVSTIQTISGPYDIQVDFLAPNPSKFNKEIKLLISEKKELSNYDVVVNVVTHQFPKKYLTRDTQNIKDNLFGGDRKYIQLDEKQKLVLKELVNDPTIKIAKLANKTALNVRTVMNIIKQLETNVIKGYKAEINTNQIDYVKNRITLKLHNLSAEKEKELRKYCTNNPAITKFSKTIGLWDLEIDVETKDIIKFRKIFLELREEFKEIIQDFNYFSVLDLYKKRLVPEDWFEE